jgi:hypothetical protein
MAVLEAGEVRTDLPCEVNPGKPLLGFDLKFHSGYDVIVPLRELAGSENLLTILFRVTEAKEGAASTYFIHRVRVPAIEEEAKGDAYLTGTFDLGEGAYKVDWLMRDRSERVCSSSWQIESVLGPKDKQLEVAVAPGIVLPSEREQFREEPPVARIADESPLNLKLMINFAPQNSHSATLQPLDTAALVSILRSISRDPRVGKFSIVAFNLQEQRVIYRQDNAERIDFPGLGQALDSLNLGVVDLKRLGERNGEVNFLTTLLQTELKDASSADAVVFAGPKTLLEQNVPQDTLEELGDLASPVFYMNYNLYPQSVPWTDAIGKTVKFFKGQEFTITRPRDLWFAVSEMVTRIVKLKHGRVDGTSSE